MTEFSKDGTTAQSADTVDGKPPGAFGFPGETQVSGPEQLPAPVLAPDGVMRVPLKLGEKYIFRASFELPRLLVPRADPLQPNLTVELVAGNASIVLSLDGDETPHIWGRSTCNFIVSDATFLDIGNAGFGRSTRVLDVMASVDGADFTLVNSKMLAVGDLGTVWDYATTTEGLLLEDAGAGLSLRTNPDANGPLFVRSCRFEQTSGEPAMVKPMIAVAGHPSLFGCWNGNHRPNDDDVVLAIAEDTTGAYDVVGNSITPETPGGMLAEAIIDSIAMMEAADIAVSAVEDSSVSPGVDSSLVVGAYTGLRRGQLILVAGLGAPYDGLKTITRVDATERKIDIAAAFTGTAAGVIASTRFTTPAPTDITEGSLAHVASASYNLSASVLFVTNTTFDLPVAFVGDDGAGTVEVNARTEKSIGVNLKANGDVKDSKSVGTGIVMANVAVTAIAAQPAWTDLTFAGPGLMAAGSDIERWEVANAATGELRLLGENFNGTGSAKISAVSSGSAQRFQFRIVKNGLPMADGALATDGLTGVTDQLTVDAPIVGAVAGDLFRVQVQNIDGTSSLVVQEFIFTTITT